MTENPALAGRKATAARNMEAILEAAERLLTEGHGLNFSAVADQAGVSRPTVYAHFPDRPALLSALVDRSIRQALAAIASAQPDHGPAPQALGRLATTGWRHLARHVQIARAAANDMPAAALHAHHEEAVDTIEALVKRGQRERSFRRDLPSRWLATSCLGLIHAAAHEVGSGHLDADQVGKVLPTTLVDLCVGPRQSRGR